MENKTLTPYFSNLTLAEAWEGDFDILAERGMPQNQLEALKDICKKTPNGASDVYDFLTNKDPLFRDIYGNGIFIDQEEQFTFPFIKGKKIPSGFREVVGPIGTQTSKYHKETLTEHVELVAAHLVEHAFGEELARWLATLHDVGKKYTSVTNRVGEVCFCNHAEISAFIAGHWLRQFLNYKSSKEIMAIIYAHMLPSTSWNVTEDWRTGEPVNYAEDFYQELLRFCKNNKVFADHIFSRIYLFSLCDVGVTEFTPAIFEKIAKGHRLICG